MLRRAAFALCVILTASVTYAAAEHIVAQKGKLFSPGTVRVKMGDTLVFKNDDSVTHHVYSSTKGQEFELDTTKPGQAVRRTFPSKGRVEVRCGLHPGMRLVVTVE
jgi:plastocyanin